MYLRKNLKIKEFKTMKKIAPKHTENNKITKTAPAGKTSEKEKVEEHQKDLSNLPIKPLQTNKLTDKILNKKTDNHSETNETHKNGEHLDNVGNLATNITKPVDNTTSTTTPSKPVDVNSGATTTPVDTTKPVDNTAGTSTVTTPSTTSSDSIFTSTTGNEKFTATTAKDTFVFPSKITGQDVITGFDPKADVLQFGASTGQHLGSANIHNADYILKYATVDSGSDVVIMSEHAGSTITLLGVHKADLSATNFDFYS